MKTININERVTVRLTLAGRQILDQFEAKEHAEFVEAVGRPPAVRFRRLEPDGTLTETLWDLMKIFGPHLEIGRDGPFEGCEIVVRDRPPSGATP